MHLVVVAGFGEEPILLLTNALAGARDSQSLWWIAQSYLMRWKIEKTFRFIKQSYKLEDIRVMKISALEELSRAGDSRRLLCRDLPRTENEASHPVRKADDHLAAVFRHPALPVLCAGRRNQETSLPNQPRPTREIASQSTTGIAAGLGSAEILKKLLTDHSDRSLLTQTCWCDRLLSLRETGLRN